VDVRMLAAKVVPHIYRKSRKNYLGDLAQNMECGFDEREMRLATGLIEEIETRFWPKGEIS